MAEREGLCAYFQLRPNLQAFLASHDAVGTDAGTMGGTSAKRKGFVIATATTKLRWRQGDAGAPLRGHEAGRRGPGPSPAGGDGRRNR